MERLTEWNDEQTRHAYYPRCFEDPCYGSGCKIENCPFEAAVCDRLAAYEDTGLTPEELKAALTKPLFLRVAAQALGVDIGRLSELAEADKDGRVVVQGQWEGEGDGYADGEIVLDVWHCSQCGYCIDDGTDNPKCLPKHCPNCGAKMDGGCENA